MTNPFDLARFVTAQAGVYARALAEIRNGAKRSHWMWFIFPQLAGLGTSAMARRYAIGSLGEAAVYLDHAVLGPRYHECVGALQHLDPLAEAVFGPIDAVKLRSSLTLFSQVSDDPLYAATLRRWFGGDDPLTLRLLGVEGQA